jgi:hypothetical protein
MKPVQLLCGGAVVLVLAVMLVALVAAQVGAWASASPLAHFPNTLYERLVAPPLPGEKVKP